MIEFAMKKNVILIDLDLALIESIYESEKVNIEFLITEADDVKLVEIKDQFDIKNIITREKFNEFVAQEVTNIDYDIIEKFKSSQLNSEHFQTRISDDTNLMQYHYFNALSFWMNVFAKNNIFAVILEGTEHGANYDSLAFDVAKAHNVSGYIIDHHMRRNEKEIVVAVRSVLDYNLKKRVPVDCNKLNLKPIEIKDYLFYLDKIATIPSKEKRKRIKDTVKYFLPDYVPAAAHMLASIIRNKPIRMHSLNSSPTTVLRNMFHIRKMRRLHRSISVELDTSKKYIIYTMHFEPEASIMARARFSNQLMIIKQLSQSLPKGWILYVKEHPYQFDLDGPGM